MTLFNYNENMSIRKSWIKIYEFCCQLMKLKGVKKTSSFFKMPFTQLLLKPQFCFTSHFNHNKINNTKFCCG